MADQEEDFSSLPLTDRFTHKNWKVRKEAYEAAKKEFDSAQTEADPLVQQFTRDSSLWKAAVADSNVAAHQEALSALCSFLQIAGTSGCTRTRGATIAPIAEKGLVSTKPAAKASALEAILLYVEMDKADPVIEELLPLLSHKTPKVIAATLSAFTSLFHAYGCKTVAPRPILQALTKAYGHADKNVRAEAQNVTVELYRWLREGIKPLFWNELKPVQQQDLEKLFEKVKDEPTPKPERLLKSQQAAVAAAAEQPSARDAEGEDEAEGEEDLDLEPEVLAVDAFAKIPKDLMDRLGSSKWKDRKEALDELFQAINFPALEPGPFDDVMKGLAKSMKDANIAVVTVAGNCVEALAKGLRRSFAKYRSTIFSPIMERLKERKQSVTDALAAALDAVCASTSISDCLEELQGFLAHKNPLVKLEATRFLVRNLASSREAPSVPDTKVIAEATSKLLTDSQETQRNAAAEVLGILLKIMGDRIMMVHLEGFDDIRKAKVKEYAESAEVKSKYKPKTAAPAKSVPAPAAQKKVLGKKPPPKKTTAPPPQIESPSPPRMQPKPTAKPGLARPTAGSAPRSLKPPSSGISGRKLPATTSPRRTPAAPAPQLSDDDEPAQPAPKAPSRGLTGRQLSKPTDPTNSSNLPPPNSNAQSSSLNNADRHELDTLRSESTSLRTLNDSLRASHLKLTSQVHELQNQNAQLIEDHTRDVLSIKAKETQLVRARSDAETAEQTSLQLQREVERLKRELGRMGRASSPRASDIGASDIFSHAESAPTAATAAAMGGGGGGARGAGAAGFGAQQNAREGKENALPPDMIGQDQHSQQQSQQKPRPIAGRRLSPPVRTGVPGGGAAAAASSMSPKRQSVSSRPVGGSGYGQGGIGRPPREAAPPPSSSAGANGSRNRGDEEGARNHSTATSRSGSFRGRDSFDSGGGSKGSTGGEAQGGDSGVESWKRAAEVTQNLKARIELMRARQQGRG